jgi:hypothetical protein
LKFCTGCNVWLLRHVTESNGIFIRHSVSDRFPVYPVQRFATASYVHFRHGHVSGSFGSDEVTYEFETNDDRSSVSNCVIVRDDYVILFIFFFFLFFYLSFFFCANDETCSKMFFSSISFYLFVFIVHWAQRGRCVFFISKTNR